MSQVRDIIFIVLVNCMAKKYFIKPKTKRGEATLEKIVEAAAAVFYEKGFHDGSIADITQRAGVGNGTFYIYFDSKLSVYRHLLMEYGKRVRARSSEAIVNCTSRREAERLGLRAFFEYALEDQSIFTIIWESLYIDKTLFYDYYATFSKAYVRGLKEAQAEGEVRDIDPAVLSYVLMGIANFVALNSLVLKPEQEHNVDYLVDEVMKVLENGMFN